MGHFVVAVFSNDPEEYDDLLAPYDEQTEDSDCLEFVRADEKESELRAEFETHDSGNSDNFDDFLSSCYGYSRNKDGEIGYMTNPNSEWDWYEVGGRWHGMLKLKSGCCCTRKEYQGKPGFCDQALVKDVDFSDFNVSAYITPEGEWFDIGTVGWFMTSNEAEDRLKQFNDELKEMIAENPDLYITIVDCHI